MGKPLNIWQVERRGWADQVRRIEQSKECIQFFMNLLSVEIEL
jgi:hypothetical protein